MNQKIMLLACVCLLVLVSAASACTITIVKKTNGGNNLEIPVGAAVTWTYAVSSDSTLCNIDVKDNKTGVNPVYQSGDTNHNGVLNHGETWIYSATGTAVAGLYCNKGTATGKYNGVPVEPGYSKSCYTGVTPNIALDKVLANGLEGTSIAAGTPLTWDYTVTNTGDVTLTGVGVTDSKGVIVTCPKDTLAAGESMVCTGTGVAGSDAYTNTGTATGNFGSDPVTTVTASDDSSYTGTASGGSSGSAVPEFPSMALPAAFIVGLLGVVLFIKGTREVE